MSNNTHRLLAATGSALLFAQAGIALAQTQPAKPERGEHMRARWQQADLDKDGQLSKAEVQAAGMKHLLERFDAIDTNKDGKISEAELAAFGNARHDNRSATPVPGQAAASPFGKAPMPAGSNPPPPPRPPHEEGKHGGMDYKSPDQRRAAMQERFNKADTNKDGGLSKAELQAAGMQRLVDHFDVIDTNKDGKITSEEMRAAWERSK